jgi:hypothetical protein
LLTHILAKGGKVADPPGATSKRVEMAVRTKTTGAKTVKMRYGPYKVPNMKVTNILGEEGALWNYADPVAAKPCDESMGGECTIIGMNAGLEYPDGRNANIDSGLWLHHVRYCSYSHWPNSFAHSSLVDGFVQRRPWPSRCNLQGQHRFIAPYDCRIRRQGL